MFNYTDALGNLIREITQRVEDLAHVDPERLLVAWTRSRDNGPVGAYAKIVPLRFEAGARERRIGRHTYEMPGLLYQGKELLYLLYFYMPRFADLPYRQALDTVVH